MAARVIEIFSAGCPACDRVVQRVHDMAGPSCEIQVRDMHAPYVADVARQMGVHRLPAIVVDGEVMNCCKHGEIDEQELRAAGIGTPLIT